MGKYELERKAKHTQHFNAILQLDSRHLLIERDVINMPASMTSWIQGYLEILQPQSCLVAYYVFSRFWLQFRQRDFRFAIFERLRKKCLLNYLLGTGADVDIVKLEADGKTRQPPQIEADSLLCRDETNTVAGAVRCHGYNKNISGKTRGSRRIKFK